MKKPLLSSTAIDACPLGAQGFSLGSPAGPTNPLLRPPAAAAYLRGKFGFGAKRTLDKLRVIGGGPLYRRFGRMILYEIESLDAWATARLGPLQRSASDCSVRTKRSDTRLQRTLAVPSTGGDDAAIEAAEEHFADEEDSVQ
jgi:hypothetical protein